MFSNKTPVLVTNYLQLKLFFLIVYQNIQESFGLVDVKGCESLKLLNILSSKFLAPIKLVKHSVMTFENQTQNIYTLTNIEEPHHSSRPNQTADASCLIITAT
jgi:hypothetical protein